MNKENFEILELISDIDQITMESEFAVIESLMDYYGKCSTILENVHDEHAVEEMTVFAESAVIFEAGLGREAAYAAKKGIAKATDKVDEWTKTKTEGNIFKRIGLGIVKAIASLAVRCVRFFQGISARKKQQAIKETEEAVRQANEASEEILAGVESILNGESTSFSVDGEEFDFGEEEDLGESYKYSDVNIDEMDVIEEGVGSYLAKKAGSAAVNTAIDQLKKTDIGAELAAKAEEKKLTIAKFVRRHDNMTPAEKKALIAKVNKYIDATASKVKDRTGKDLDMIEKIIVANLKDPNAPAKEVIQNIERKCDDFLYKLGKFEVESIEAGVGAVKKAIKVAAKSVPEVLELVQTVYEKVDEIGNVSEKIANGQIQATETIKAIAKFINDNEGVIGTLDKIKDTLHNLQESYENTSARQKAEIKKMLTTTIRYCEAFNKLVGDVQKTLKIDISVKQKQISSAVDKANEKINGAIAKSERAQLVISIADENVKKLVVKMNQASNNLRETYSAVRVSEDTIKKGIGTLKVATKEATDAAVDLLAGTAKYAAGVIIELDSIEGFIKNLGESITQIGTEMENAAKNSAAFIEDEEIMTAYSQCMTQLYGMLGNLTKVAGLCATKSISNPTAAKKLIDKQVATMITQARGIKTKDDRQNVVDA